ncbi:MAG TPA: alpha/beta fold hydrolase, partial [Phycisphaerae bacterium]
MPPHLILMPGLHGTGGLFAPLLDQIPREYPTRLIEYPRDRAQSYPQLLLQIERDLQDLEQVILIAESFSGPLALQFAARHPSRVRAVILCVTFVTAPVPRILCWLGAPFALIRFPLPGFLIRMFLAGTAASKEVVRHARREIEASKSHVIAHRVISAGSVDARPALRNCGMPILCLSGSRDRLIGRRSHRTIL